MEIIEWTQEALALASDQDVFDYVVGFIRQQGAPAMSADGFCSYEADEGKRCAVGCLLPSGQFKGRLGTVDEPKNEDMRKILSAEEGSRRLDLLKRLQEAHDGHYLFPGFVERFVERFEVEVCAIVRQSIVEGFPLIYTPPTSPTPKETP
jgi:hypothetical protein